MSRRPDPGDRGAVSALVAVLGLAIVVVLALVVHGGRTLGALSEAQDIADNAARAGSQAVDLERWRADGRPVIDRDRASVAIDDFMIASGLAQRVESWQIVAADGPDPEVTVAVEVTVSPRPFVFPRQTVTAVGTASALDGPAP